MFEFLNFLKKDSKAPIGSKPLTKRTVDNEKLLKFIDEKIDNYLHGEKPSQKDRIEFDLIQEILHFMKKN